jgi:hypothetical protein
MIGHGSSLPDHKTRIYASGVLSRHGWNKHESLIKDALARSENVVLIQCKNCSKWFFTSTHQQNKCKECK